jgi:hypothetical protein
MSSVGVCFEAQAADASFDTGEGVLKLDLR